MRWWYAGGILVCNVYYPFNRNSAFFFSSEGEFTLNVTCFYSNKIFQKLGTETILIKQILRKSYQNHNECHPEIKAAKCAINTKETGEGKNWTWNRCRKNHITDDEIKTQSKNSLVLQINRWVDARRLLKVDARS